jgi:hypothetical protein
MYIVFLSASSTDRLLKCYEYHSQVCFPLLSLLSVFLIQKFHCLSVASNLMSVYTILLNPAVCCNSTFCVPYALNFIHTYGQQLELFATFIMHCDRHISVFIQPSYISHVVLDVKYVPILHIHDEHLKDVHI